MRAVLQHGAIQNPTFRQTSHHTHKNPRKKYTTWMTDTCKTPKKIPCFTPNLAKPHSAEAGPKTLARPGDMARANESSKELATVPGLASHHPLR